MHQHQLKPWGRWIVQHRMKYVLMLLFVLLIPVYLITGQYSSMKFEGKELMKIMKGDVNA